jgi:4-amino-4-deoxy-L-arabinose transferase-like glycosyltransferase
MRNRTLLIFFAAVCTRLFFAVTYQGPEYYSGISEGFTVLADNVLEGKGLMVKVNVAPANNPQPQWEYQPVIDHPVGYLFFILVPYWLFSSVGIQIFQALLSAVSAILLYQIALRMFSPNTAFLSAMLYACWPLSARFEVAILPDAAVSFFLILAVWFIVRSQRTEKSKVDWILAGIAFGIAMLMRADVMLLPFFIVATFFLLKRTRVLARRSLLLLVGAGIGIAPNAIRNYIVTGGHVVPLGLGNGISLWEGISQFGDTLGTVYGDARMVEREGYHSWAYPSGIERDKKRFKEAVGIILAHPVWYAGVMLRRIPIVLRPDGIIASKFMPPPKELAAESSGVGVIQYLMRYPIGAFIQVLLILLQGSALVLATIAAVKRWNDRLILLPITVIVYYFVIHLGTNAEPRYFYPAIPFVLLLAGESLMQLRSKLTRT